MIVTFGSHIGIFVIQTSLYGEPQSSEKSTDTTPNPNRYGALDK